MPRTWLAEHCRQFLFVWLACIAALALQSLGFGGQPFGLGPDPDDAMRFVQLRDLLEGGGWFDLHQQRLGLEGTDIHWSRLADLPFLLVAWPLQVFVGADAAIRIAGTVVPLLLSGLLVGGWLRGLWALHNARPGTEAASKLPMSAIAVVPFFALAFAPRFGFGAFDHHHLQIGLLAVALGVSLVARPSRLDGAVVGIALGMGVVIGLETAPHIAALCGVWALLWAWQGEARAQATVAFGTTLAVTALVGLLVFTSRSWQVCDAFGLPLAGWLVLGGSGLAAGAALSPGSRGPRLLCLGGIALAAAAWTLAGAQGCLANPMSALSEDVRLNWLAHVTEARPITSAAVPLPVKAATSGPILSAMLAGVFMAVRARGRERWLLAGLVAFAAVSLSVTLYQIRFYTFAMVPAALLLGTALIRALEWDTSPLRRMPTVLAVAALSLGALHGMAATLVTSGPDAQTGIVAADARLSVDCASDQTLSVMDALPASRFLVPLDTAPQVLATTRQSVVAGNYHRGWRDIGVVLELYRLPSEGRADALRGHGIDYVLDCDTAEIQGFWAATPGLDATVPGLPQGVAIYPVE